MKLNLTRPLVFFDIESTGLDVSKDYIVELCYIKVFPNGNEEAKNTTSYRGNTGMTLHHRYADRNKRFPFDGEWAQYVLRLREGEFACYSLYDVTVLSKLEVACYTEGQAQMEIYQDEELLGRFDLSGAPHRQILSSMHLNNADACVLKLKAISGIVDIETLRTETDA